MTCYDYEMRWLVREDDLEMILPWYRFGVDGNTENHSHFWNMTKTQGISWGTQFSGKNRREAKFRALAESPTGDHQWAHIADHWFQYGPNYVEIPY